MGVMDPVKLTITNWVGGTEWVEVENNPEDPNAGTRTVPFTGVLWIEREDFRLDADKKFHRLKLNEEVRLKGGYVVKATDVVMDGDVITEIKCTFDPNSKSGMTLDRKVKGVIHWVSVEHASNVDVNEYDTLFTESNPDELEDFTTCINPNSLVVNTKAMFEPHIMILEIGVPVQMMRKGYYCLDKDGAFNKTVSLKEGWKG
jgi:glutaminyl-tRNA synthetase